MRLILILTTLALVAADWPQFRGPNASGVSTDANVPIEIGPDTPATWKRDLARGHSSPIVFGDRVYVTAAADKALLTIALDRATGKTLWEAEAPSKTLEKIHPTGSRAQSSPATDGEVVVSFFGSSGLLCHDASGKRLWHRPFGPFKNDFGFGSSPIIVGNRVIMNFDQDSGSALMAFDRKTGETLWTADRGEFRRGYATPVIWEVDGRKQIVVAGTLRVVGYDLESGKEIWTATPIARLVTPTPVIGPGNILYVTGWTAGGDPGKAFDLPPFADMKQKHDANKNGTLELEEIGGTLLKDRFGQFDLNADDHVTEAEFEKMRTVFGQVKNTCLAIRPGGQGDVSKTHVLWESNKGLPSLASPVVTDKHLFLLKDGGILTCLDLKTGKEIKSARLAGTGRYYGSPVLIADKILAISQLGELTVVEANAEMRQCHGADFGMEVCATPAISEGQIFVRTAGQLHCFGKRR